MRVDDSGNAYVAGATSSTDFPVTAGVYQSTSSSGGSAYVGFITKMNPTGTALLYSTYVGGSNGDVALAIAIDGSGNAYITGYTKSTDFPVTTGAFQTTNPATTVGNGTGFVTKLNSTGAHWSIRLTWAEALALNRLALPWIALTTPTSQATPAHPTFQ
jgi:Beta-propeller repeat